jgi:hypothetical protein
MALSEDSRTLLQLLLGRGKSYDDIAGLLGVSEAEVRDRAHRALVEIHGSDPDHDVNLTDYLLGQSDPLDRAGVARELADNEAAAETAGELADQLRLLVPGAALPGATASPKPPRSRAGSSRRTRGNSPQAGSADAGSATGGSGSRASSLTAGQRRLIALVGLGALLVLVLVLLLTGAFGGDDDSGPPAPDAANAGAVMQPVGDQGGSGKVQLGRVDDSFAANLQFSELEPSSRKNTYLLWMSGSIGAFPLSEVTVGESGNFSDTIPLPPEALCSLSGGVFTDLTLTRISQAEGARVIRRTQRALRGNQPRLPDVSGDAVFAGPVALDQELRELLNQQCQTPAPAND